MMFIWSFIFQYIILIYVTCEPDCITSLDTDIVVVTVVWTSIVDSVFRKHVYSEVDIPEFLWNVDEIFPRYYLHSDVSWYIKISNTTMVVIPVVREEYINVVGEKEHSDLMLL